MAATSAPFAQEFPEQFLLLGQVAKAFSQRPSRLLAGTPNDLQIDLACAAALWKWESESAADPAQSVEAESANDVYW